MLHAASLIIAKTKWKVIPVKGDDLSSYLNFFPISIGSLVKCNACSMYRR